MAAIDLNRPGIEVSQFTDTSGYSSTLMKMLIWMPVDVGLNYNLKLLVYWLLYTHDYLRLIIDIYALFVQKSLIIL